MYNGPGFWRLEAQNSHLEIGDPLYIMCSGLIHSPTVEGPAVDARRDAQLTSVSAMKLSW